MRSTNFRTPDLGTKSVAGGLEEGRDLLSIIFNDFVGRCGNPQSVWLFGAFWTLLTRKKEDIVAFPVKKSGGEGSLPKRKLISSPAAESGGGEKGHSIPLLFFCECLVFPSPEKQRKKSQKSIFRANFSEFKLCWPVLSRIFIFESSK